MRCLSFWALRCIAFMSLAEWVHCIVTRSMRCLLWRRATCWLKWKTSRVTSEPSSWDRSQSRFASTFFSPHMSECWASWRGFCLQVEDETKQPLAGVLLSLSGGNYRSNKVTGEDGAMTFTSLVSELSLDELPSCLDVLVHLVNLSYTESWPVLHAAHDERIQLRACFSND